MLDNSTIFHQLLSPICRTDFERLSTQYHQGQKLRCASRWDQFIAMLMSQLSCRQSLRDIQSNLEVQRKRPADSPLFRHRPQRQQLIKATFWPRG